MANLARVELPPAANEAELQERVERAAAFLKRNPMPLVGDYDGPEVGGA